MRSNFILEINDFLNEGRNFQTYKDMTKICQPSIISGTNYGGL